MKYFTHKKKQNTDTWYNMGKKHDVKWSQTQKAIYYMIPFVWNDWNRQRDIESKLMAARGWRVGGNSNVTFNAYGVSFLADKIFLEL